ncbi:MAG: PEP-CTERM sorting domain-containing protein [Xenococcaceae cyanobacterium MO_188.B32]|nr:PEP-CTERM sorting domain-containing protein [Xenococcaceae cyanobacterium MO_188.B32]
MVFNLLNKTSKTAIVPLTVLGLVTTANSANATALTGEFQLGVGTIFPSTTSTVSLSSDSLIFTPQLITPISITSQTDSFTDFNTGNIGNIISFSSNIAHNPFIDFGTTVVPGLFGLYPGDHTSIIDGLNTFSLQSSSYSLNQSGSNVAVDVALAGFFTSADGDVSQGAGNLTFQINNTNVNKIEGILNDGSSISGLTFSGGLFSSSETTSVPEPTTTGAFLFLGAIGATKAARRKKIS